jgi:hypothetical protein
MSLPSALQFAARAVTARVGDGLTRWTRRETASSRVNLLAEFVTEAVHSKSIGPRTAPRRQGIREEMETVRLFD